MTSTGGLSLICNIDGVRSRLLAVVLGTLLCVAPVQADSERTQNLDQLAHLSISRLDVDVPIYAGTSRSTLKHGAGHVEGTAEPGQEGHSVISAHRDAHFVDLQHIQLGDELTLHNLDSTQQYTVVDIFVTDALDVSVLQPFGDETYSLTLITCHPFDYQGFAPDRFIVRTERQ